MEGPPPWAAAGPRSGRRQPAPGTGNSRKIDLVERAPGRRRLRSIQLSAGSSRRSGSGWRPRALSALVWCRVELWEDGSGRLLIEQLRWPPRRPRRWLGPHSGTVCTCPYAQQGRFGRWRLSPSISCSRPRPPGPPSELRRMTGGLANRGQLSARGQRPERHGQSSLRGSALPCGWREIVRESFSTVLPVRTCFTCSCR